MDVFTIIKNMNIGFMVISGSLILILVLAFFYFRLWDDDGEIESAKLPDDYSDTTL